MVWNEKKTNPLRSKSLISLTFKKKQNFIKPSFLFSMLGRLRLISFLGSLLELFPLGRPVCTHDADFCVLLWLKQLLFAWQTERVDSRTERCSAAFRLLSALQWMQLFSTEAITYRLALLRLTSNVIDAHSFFSLPKIFLFLMEIKIERKNINDANFSL